MNKFKFNEEESSRVFFTSDTHFGHTNIIKYCNRPFNSVDEMDEKLIENWNSVVKKDSLIFHLGDFSFRGPNKAKEILSKLNGNIVLIIGNHDYKSVIKLFDNVYDQLSLNLNNDLVYLNHYPFLTSAGAYRNNVYQLFGHVHTCKKIPIIEDKEIKEILNGDSGRMKYLFKNQYDVGVDNNNYTPISWKEILSKFNSNEKL